MPINAEIKVKLSDLSKLPKEIENIVRLYPGTEPVELKQCDTFYHIEEGRLKLREQGDGSGDLIRYRREERNGVNVSFYEREHVPSAEQAHRELEGRYGIKGVVRKVRHLYLADNSRFHFDRVEGLGDFFEIEIVLKDESEINTGITTAKEWMNRLGIEERDMIRCTYEDMLAVQP